MKTNIEKKGITPTELQIAIKQERITKAEAATILGVSIGTIQNHVKNGRLHPIKTGNSKQSKVYFKRDEVLSIVEFKLSDLSDNNAA